jgi:hypothetical protein
MGEKKPKKSEGRHRVYCSCGIMAAASVDNGEAEQAGRLPLPPPPQQRCNNNEQARACIAIDCSFSAQTVGVSVGIHTHW